MVKFDDYHWNFQNFHEVENMKHLVIMFLMENLSLSFWG